MRVRAGRSTLRFGASVLVPDATEDADGHAPELPPDRLPGEVLLYTLPSRYCLPDVLGDEAWSLFGALGRGRDASNAAMITTFGAPLLESMTVQAQEEPDWPAAAARSAEPGDLNGDVQVLRRRA